MSIWNIKEEKHNSKKLDKNLDLDILIIGAGMTGMTSAYYLQDEKKIAVVDANYYGHGVTLNTTAKITYLQERNYTKIKNLTSHQTAARYLQSQKNAIDCLIDIIKKENINCDLKKTPSYIFANTKKEIPKLRNEVNFLKQNNISITKDKLVDAPKYYEAYKVDDTYTFNPIKYLNHLYKIISKKIPLYENTKVTKITYKNNLYYCYTENFCIKTKKVILACHYPFFTLPLLMPLKGSIEKSYMIVTKTKNNPNISAISTAKPTYSYRYYEDDNNIYKISLAESHDTAWQQNDLEHFKHVKEIFNINDKDIITSYSNVDIISHDYIPYIGKIHKNMYISTGYNTWGMTNSVLGAKIITESIKNNTNYYDIFKPTRKNIALFLKIPIHIINQIKSFIGTKINKNKSWYKENVKFYTKNGKNLASYKDMEGQVHTVHNKCPHLGCSLIFNEQEKTWDCPCHSSRFNIDGKCIKGPSLYDISYKKEDN